MNRRTFIGAFGSLIGGISLALGSSAFSFVRANRELTVEVVRDYNAYLALESRQDDGRSAIVDGRLQLQFPGINEDQDNGVGTESLYEFDHSGFEVTNQGTEEIEVHVERIGSEEPIIEVYDHEDSDREEIHEDNRVRLGVGEKLIVGIRIDTRGVDFGSYDETLRIAANETA